MNKKGFTLIELLAVIVILSSISIATVVSITSSLTRREIKECEEQVALAKNAAKIYFSLNADNTDGVTVGCLKGNGANCTEVYLEDKKVDKLKNELTIKVTNNEYVIYDSNTEFTCSKS